MKIGDLAKICDVSIKTIRFYETKNLLTPCEVDIWTGYRYYNEESVKKLSEIKFLKSLGFSLKEIQGFNEKQIAEKTKQIESEIKKLKNNILKLNSISKNKEGEFNMKTFVNDERVIGKWEKVGVVKQKEDYYNGKFYTEEDIFAFNELYFMPEGEEYWVVSWTKDIVYIKDRKNPYQIENDLMFIGVTDYKDGNVYFYAVYKKVDSNIYTPDQIRIKDNLNVPFVADNNLVGFWEVINYTHNKEDFLEKSDIELFLKNYAFSPDGNGTITFGENVSPIKWTKNYVLNPSWETASEYVIKQANGNDYLIVEWKSGDYMFGGRVYGYYVLKKIK